MGCGIKIDEIDVGPFPLSAALHFSGVVISVNEKKKKREKHLNTTDLVIS